METIIFMFCLTLHNMEEALWFTNWAENAMPKNLSKNEHFIFAVTGITILGYLSAGMFALFPDNKYFEYAFIGFVGAMLINAIVPHLLLTVRFRKYCPGVFTGCFLIIPFHLIILLNAANNRMKVSEIIISTFAVGVILLGTIPVLKSLAKIVLDR